MNEPAPEFPPTSPASFSPTSPSAPAPSPGVFTGAPPPEPQRCSLCSTPLPVQAERCPSCGLWMGGHGRVASATLLRVTAVFVAVYVVALLFVALAR